MSWALVSATCRRDIPALGRRRRSSLQETHTEVLRADGCNAGLQNRVFGTIPATLLKVGKRKMGKKM